MGTRFRVLGNRLLDRGREVIVGPTRELLDMADALNRHPPKDLTALRDRMCELIQQTRACSFAPGPVLKGEPAPRLRNRGTLTQPVGGSPIRWNTDLMDALEECALGDMPIHSIEQRFGMDARVLLRGALLHIRRRCLERPRHAEAAE